jgi:hypothetical protein
MILRIKPRIRDRPRRLIFTRPGRSGLLLGVWCAMASAAPPAPPPGSPPASPPTSPPATTPVGTPGRTLPPDEGLLEFLGSDDVGDAAWWEFLKRAPPGGSIPPATPSQDAKK